MIAYPYLKNLMARGDGNSKKNGKKSEGMRPKRLQWESAETDPETNNNYMHPKAVMKAAQMLVRRSVISKRSGRENTVRGHDEYFVEKTLTMSIPTAAIILSRATSGGKSMSENFRGHYCQCQAPPYRS